MSNSDCIFCRIVSGELPSCMVYEDDDSAAFMDIGPIIQGHALVIPKRHFANIFETPPELLQKVITVVRKIAQAQADGLDADGVNVVQSNGKPAGQVVPHIHFHVIPRFVGDGHSWNWNPASYSGTGEMEKFAERIRRYLPK